MGAGIAQWLSSKGKKVYIKEVNEELVAKGLKTIGDLYVAGIRRHKFDRSTARASLDNIVPVTANDKLHDTGIVIEAIVEKLDVKQNVLAELEEYVSPDCIIATNTSALSIDDIACKLKQPERFIGIHFFNPVAKMPLVEVVRGEKTSDEIMGNATAFVHAIGKLPVQVKSYPGFLVNRVLMPYLMEALYLYQEGIPPAFIDKAALKFGMPMGPIELSDTVGLDVCLHVAKNLSQYFGTDVPDLLEKKVAAGELGAKSGQGFYKWNAKGKPEKPESGSSKLSEAVVIDRLILRMLNESVACLREEIVADKDLLDAGMIFGTGFAPFRGGPMHYAEHVGVKAIVDQLSDFTENFGDRFKPDEGWSLLNKE